MGTTYHMGSIVLFHGRLIFIIKLVFGKCIRIHGWTLLAQAKHQHHSLQGLFNVSQNQTMEWLNSKSADELQNILSSTHLQHHKVSQLFSQRHLQIVKLQREAILENQKKSEELFLKKQKLLEQYTQAIVEHGLWQTEEEVNCNLDDYTSMYSSLPAHFKINMQISIN